MLRTLPIVFLLGALAPFASPQWSSDAGSNVEVAGGGSDQTQPKVEAHPTEGTWVSWFDGIASGFDVRVQRLDGQGVEQFPHAGVLVADRGFSSTQDYGLAVTTTGDAVLAYRDDSGTGTQISASRVSPSGTLEWTTTLTATAAFVAAPAVATGPSGSAYVAWTEGSSVRVQLLTPTGVEAWPTDTVLSPATGGYSLSDLQASLDGVIVSLIEETGGFGSPRHLLAQRLVAFGFLDWGGSPVTVFDAGSLQFGNFPDFAPDGSGGAVFSWYDAGSSQLQCYVQHVLADGTQAYPVNGAAVSTNVTRVRVSPDATFDPSTGEVTVAWVELNATQSQSGLAAQRFDGAGNRLWGNQGQVLVNLGSEPIGDVRARASGTSTFLTWTRQVAFGNDQLEALRLGSGGAVELSAFPLASTVSGKARVDAARTAWGDLVAVWVDDRLDAGDVYGQNIRCDGALGPIVPGEAWTDLGAGLAGTTGVPTLTGAGSLCPATEASLTLAGALPGTTAALVLGLSQLSAPFKGGTLVPSADLILAGLPTGAGGFSVPLAVPAVPASGLQLFWQFWITDAGGPAGFAASNGLRSEAP